MVQISSTSIHKDKTLEKQQQLRRFQFKNLFSPPYVFPHLIGNWSIHGTTFKLPQENRWMKLSETSGSKCPSRDTAPWALRTMSRALTMAVYYCDQFCTLNTSDTSQNVWVFHTEQFFNSLVTPTGVLQFNSILTLITNSADPHRLRALPRKTAPHFRCQSHK